MLIDSSLFERIYFHLRFCTSTEYSFDMFINGNGALFFHTSPSLPLLQDNDVSLFYGNIILPYVMFIVLGIRSRGFFRFLGCNSFGNKLFIENLSALYHGWSTPTLLLNHNMEQYTYHVHL